MTGIVARIGAAALSCVLSTCFYAAAEPVPDLEMRLVYDDGPFACMLGCDPTGPIAVGAQTSLRLELRPEMTDAFRVVSADPEIIAVIHEPGGSDVTLAAVEPGVTSLEIRRPDGIVLETHRVEASEATRIEVERAPSGRPLQLMVGGETRLSIALFDDQWRRLRGVGAVDYRVGGSLTEVALTLVGPRLDSEAVPVEGVTRETLKIRARSVGEGVIRLRSSASRSTVPVTVVDASFVARLEVHDDEPAGREVARLRLEAFDSEGDVIEQPTCDWSVVESDAAVQVRAIRRGTVGVRTRSATRATILCTLGESSTSRELVFPRRRRRRYRRRFRRPPV